VTPSLRMMNQAGSGREDPNVVDSDGRSWTHSPIQEKRSNHFPSALISCSKRSNFENRTEAMESRASEINEPFGEKWADFTNQGFSAPMRNRCYYWA
jgi:hypothetical protein